MAARAGDRNAPPVYLAGKVSDKSRPLVYHALKNGPFKSEVTGATVNRYLAEPDDLEHRDSRPDRYHDRSADAARLPGAGRVDRRGRTC